MGTAACRCSLAAARPAPARQEASVALAVAAVTLDDRIIFGAVALVAIVLIQRVRRRLPVAPVKIIGISQMLLGFTLVAATVVGVAAL